MEGLRSTVEVVKVESRFGVIWRLDLFVGDWIWLLEIGLAARFVSWIWDEHEKQTIMFLQKKNEK